MRSLSFVGLAAVLAAWTPTVAFADGFEEQSASVRHERHVARHARACVGVARTGSWEDWFGTFEEGREARISDGDIAARYCWHYTGEEPNDQAALARAENVIRNTGRVAASCTVCQGQASSSTAACGPRTIGATDTELNHPFVSLYDPQGNLVVVDRNQLQPTGYAWNQGEMPVGASMQPTASVPSINLPASGDLGADVDADGIPDAEDVDIGNDGVVDAIQSVG